MENETENLDSLNEENENADSEKGETNEGEPDLDALKGKIEDLSGKNKQLFERAKKAEGFEKNTEGKWIKTQKPEVKPELSELKPQLNEPDYAKIAYLNSTGISHPDDQKLVQDEAARLKLPLTDVLQMEHIKAKLEANKDDREAKAGMPKGRGQAGGKTQGDVDYWIDQKNPDGTFKTPEDPELAEKVIDARMKKEKSGKMFSDELFTK